MVTNILVPKRRIVVPKPPSWLRADYRFSEGSGLYLRDQSRYRNSADIDGATWSTDRAPGCLLFDGTNDLVDLGQPSELDFGSGDFTIELSFKSSDNLMLYDSGSGGAGFAYVLIRHSPTALRIDDGVNVASIITSLASYLDGEWHLLTFGRDGNVIRAIVDDAQHGSDTDCSSVGSVNSGKDTQLGYYRFIGLAEYYKGYIGSFRATGLPPNVSEAKARYRALI